MAGSDYDDWSTPALLRTARRAYGSAIREALGAAGFDDVPRNGSYVIGAIARAGVPLAEIIERMGVPKQTAGQLVDTLVARGYLDRVVDAADRRRLTVSLTERGRAAAGIIGSAVEDVDGELLRRVGVRHMAAGRRMLTALAELTEAAEAAPRAYD